MDGLNLLAGGAAAALSSLVVLVQHLVQLGQRLPGGGGGGGGGGGEGETALHPLVAVVPPENVPVWKVYGLA